MTVNFRDLPRVLLCGACASSLLLPHMTWIWQGGGGLNSRRAKRPWLRGSNRFHNTAGKGFPRRDGRGRVCVWLQFCTLDKGRRWESPERQDEVGREDSRTAPLISLLTTALPQAVPNWPRALPLSPAPQCARRGAGGAGRLAHARRCGQTLNRAHRLSFYLLLCLGLNPQQLQKSVGGGTRWR